MYGKTTISRSGRTGSSSGIAKLDGRSPMTNVSSARKRNCRADSPDERNPPPSVRVLDHATVLDPEQVGPLVGVAVRADRDHARDARVRGDLLQAVAHVLAIARGRARAGSSARLAAS
jgi:hypothetical protein